MTRYSMECSDRTKAEDQVDLGVRHVFERLLREDVPEPLKVLVAQLDQQNTQQNSFSYESK